MSRTARALLVLVSALAGCGSSGDLRRCGSDGDCGAGAVCERPVGGEQGVCIAPYAVAIQAPAAGAWVGAAGVAVRATASAQASGRSAPASLDLLADGAPVAALSRQADGSYQATWVPPAGATGSRSLAAVAARGTGDETASGPVAVRVDTAPPVFQQTLATCAGGCVRDGTLDLSAQVTGEPAGAALEFSLDLDPSRWTALPPAGVATVSLGDWPFPALSRDVLVTFRATDPAGNRTLRAVTVPVTRVRWAYDAGAPVTSPAVMADGTLVVGVAATSNQVRAIKPDGTLLWQASTGTSFVTAAPSVGPTAIWAATSDGHVFAVKPDGSAILNGAGCATGGAIQGTPAVGSGSPETVFAGSSSGRLFAADPGGACVRSLLTDAFAAPTSVTSTGLILAATATATATLRQYVYDGALGENWNVAVGVSVSAPIAIDGSGNAWTGSQDAKVNATTPAGATATVRTLGGSVVDSPIVLAGGDLVVGDQARVLHRLHPDGTPAWSAEPVLGGPVLAPVALAGGEAALLVPTAAGTLHAVAADGTVLWGGALTAGQALREASIQAPGAGPRSTAYLGSADGRLYAVVVEGRLDVAAPWPKAHRDLRNSSNAGGTLP